MNTQTGPSRAGGPHSTAGRQSGGLPLATAVLSLIALGLAIVLLGSAGSAYQSGLLSLGAAFAALRYGVVAAFAAGGLGLVALASRAWSPQRRPAVVGGLVLFVSVGLLIVPVLHWQRAQEVPPIHDITTDTANPPAFSVLAPAREQAPNALAYPGEETARLQAQAYPEIEPIYLDAPLSQVREAARASIEAFGWDLAAVTDTQLEATATTPWFGFKDDVVIRLTETPEGVRVDMRSASRVGRSDVGTNAARIHAYLVALQLQVQEAGRSFSPAG